MEPVDPRVQEILSQIEAYQTIARQGYNVPTRQALPVASQPDIAFRPSCTQLVPVWEPGRTAWVWQGQTIYKVPGQAIATETSLANLQAAGICLTGPQARYVPLVATDEVLLKLPPSAAVVAAPVANGLTPVVKQCIQDIAAVAWPTGWTLFVWAAIPMVLVGIGIGFWGRTVTGR
jgi:hypothetical protein